MKKDKSIELLQKKAWQREYGRPKGLHIRRNFENTNVVDVFGGEDFLEDIYLSDKNPAKDIVKHMKSTYDGEKYLVDPDIIDLISE